MEILTVRQQEILSLLAEGISNKEIANRLNIAEGTVKIHLQAIFDRIGVRRRTKAILWFVALTGNPER